MTRVFSSHLPARCTFLAGLLIQLVLWRSEPTRPSFHLNGSPQPTPAESPVESTTPTAEPAKTNTPDPSYTPSISQTPTHTKSNETASITPDIFQASPSSTLNLTQSPSPTEHSGTLLVTPSPEPTTEPSATLSPTVGNPTNPPAVDCVNPGEVLINEVAWAGSNASPSDEWIELLNLTSSRLTLDGWRLIDNDDIEARLSGALEPFSYYLMERSDDSTISNIAADHIYSGSLHNNGERLRLLDACGEVIDRANQSGGSWPGGDSGRHASMERWGGDD